MAIGSTMAAILAGTAIAGSTATSIVAANNGNDIPESSSPVTESASDTIAKSQQTASAAAEAKKRAASRSRSIFSSPLGIAGEASTIKKTLLGQ